jgi:hypothetical protein
MGERSRNRYKGRFLLAILLSTGWICLTIPDSGVTHPHAMPHQHYIWGIYPQGSSQEEVSQSGPSCNHSYDVTISTTFNAQQVFGNPVQASIGIDTGLVQMSVGFPVTTSPSWVPVSTVAPQPPRTCANYIVSNLYNVVGFETEILWPFWGFEYGYGEAAELISPYYEFIDWSI